MVGNFSSIFLTSMDRWFVKGLLSNVDFATYSFAVSMEGLINVAISPFTVTLYNYFCQEWRVEKIKKIHNLILLSSSGIVSVAFLLKYIIESWLVEYVESISVVFYLFGSQILFIIIKSVYVNLYKSNHQREKYFKKLIIVLFSGAIFNGICISIWHVKEAIAFGTFLSALLWYVLCQLDFKEIRYDWKHTMYLIITIATFILSGNYFNAPTGFAIYIFILILFTVTLLRPDMVEAIDLYKRIVHRYKSNE